MALHGAQFGSVKSSISGLPADISALSVIVSPYKPDRLKAGALLPTGKPRAGIAGLRYLGPFEWRRTIVRFELFDARQQASILGHELKEEPGLDRQDRGGHDDCDQPYLFSARQICTPCGDACARFRATGNDESGHSCQTGVANQG